MLFLQEKKMKVVITGRNFTIPGSRGTQMLRDAGYEVADYGGLGLANGAPEEQIAALVKDADIVIAGVEPYNEKVFEKCPNLKLISRRGIGYDSVDLEACRKRGITLTRTVGAVEGSVAEHVMAYLLYFARRLDLQSSSMHRGEWKRQMMPGLKTRTLGIVGFGGIGQEIAKRAAGFGVRILYSCRHPRPEAEKLYHAEWVPLDTLLAESDYVSVNVPLTEQTAGMCNAGFFAKMKKGGCFINISRSQVMIVEDLCAALSSGQVGCAGIDVFPKEPCTDSPLIAFDNVILTPHTAPYTSENFCQMNDIAAENVIRWANGTLEEKYRLV